MHNIILKNIKKRNWKMEEKEKKSKRVRHPKKKEEKEEQPKHFVLEVQDGNGFTSDNFGK